MPRQAFRVAWQANPCHASGMSVPYPSRSPKMSAALWLQLVILSVLWGGSFLLGRIATTEIPALTLAFARVVLAAAALWLFFLGSRRTLPPLSGLLPPLLLLGLLNNAIPFSLIFWGQREIGAGLASVLNAMTPVWTVMLAQVITRDEKLTLEKSIAVLTGFVGVAVLVGETAANGLSGPIPAKLAVLAASLSYAAAAIFGRRFRAVDPVFIACGQLSASAILLFPAALVMDGAASLSMPSAATLMAVLALALLCTAVAYVLFFRILAAAGATNTSLVTFLIPVSALLLGAWLLDEKLSRSDIAGMALIAIALLLIDGRSTRWFKRALG